MNEPSTSPLMSLIDIIKKYRLGNNEHVILKGISLHVNTGDMLAIVGSSGSGKSTLMNLIGLLDKIDSGQYHFQGVNIPTLSDNELARLRNECIGFVFQQFNLLPRLNALQNVMLPLTYRRLSTTRASKLAQDALTLVNMQNFSQHKPTQLSGGQQQRVAIARALVGEPDIILADEPTGALDSTTSNEIMALFLKLHREGRTLILITHDHNVASMCSRKITLADGQII